MKNPHMSDYPPRRRRHQAGFSMVEVMLALSVLLVAVLGAFSSQAASSNLIRISRETDLALADLQACMEGTSAGASRTVPPSADGLWLAFSGLKATTRP